MQYQGSLFINHPDINQKNEEIYCDWWENLQKNDQIDESNGLTKNILMIYTNFTLYMLSNNLIDNWFCLYERDFQMKMERSKGKQWPFISIFVSIEYDDFLFGLLFNGIGKHLKDWAVKLILDSMLDMGYLFFLSGS